MNYHELIYLKKELNFKLADCFLDRAITPFRNQLELFIGSSEKSFRLIFSAIPGNIALFLDTHRPAKKSNTLHFFESVEGAKIKEIDILENDRFLWITFENGYKLWFRLFGNRANAFLSKDGAIVDTFKDQDEMGATEPQPPEMELFQKESLSGNIAQKLQQLNPLFPKWELQEMARYHALDSASDADLRAFMMKCDQQKRESPEFRILRDGRTTMLNAQILPVPTNETAPCINDLILYRFKNHVFQQRLHQRKSEFAKLLKRQLKRTNSSLRNLAEADKGIEKAEKYEQFGHILMASAHLGVSETSVLELEDFYNPGQTVQIPVDKKLSIAENGEHYYKRSAASLKSYEEAVERIPELEQRKNRLELMIELLADVVDLRQLEDWNKRFNKELESLGVGRKKEQVQSVPYHVLELRGYQLWLGKNAKSNDKIVQFSHKEDVWMHARGVPGSHLVIRMKNNKNMPDAQLIEEAASFAAFHSKAKGSKLVPVIFTKRKYVRKPKGAAPGAVLVQKEEVVIVEPKNPQK